jgi:hypothetical protein
MSGPTTLGLPSVKAFVSDTIPATYAMGQSTLPTLPAPIVNAALAVADSRLLSGHPVLIFDIAQVVNLTYPANFSFEGTMMNNYPVLRTDFRLVRGVTNEVVFFIRDIDRKPVSLGNGDTLTINIIDPATQTLLMTRDLTVFDLAKGIYQFATLPAEMDTWPTGPVRWSVSYTRASGGTIMMWTDMNYSPYSSLYVTESTLGGPAPTITIPWDDFGLLTCPPRCSPSWPSLIPSTSYYHGPLAGAAQDGYLNGMQTFVPSMVDFTGTIEIDATLVAQPDMSAESPDWFSVSSTVYTAFTGNDTYNITGNYIWLRIAVIWQSGSVTQIQYKV